MQMSTYKKVADLTPEKRAQNLKIHTRSQVRWMMKKEGLDPNDLTVMKDYVNRRCQRKIYYRLYPEGDKTPVAPQKTTPAAENGLFYTPPLIVCTVGLTLDPVPLDAIRNEITAQLGTLDVHLKVDDKEIAEISARLKKQLREALHCEDVSPFEALWLIADLCKKTCVAVEKLLEEVKKRETH